MKKIFLIVILGIVFGRLMFAEPTDWTWHDYEIYCYKVNREPTFDEYKTLQKDACFGEEEKEVIKLFEAANKGENK